MANLSQLQMPSIDSGQLSGKDGKKIKSYLFQIQEMLRYALNDIDEDNLSEELRRAVEGVLNTYGLPLSIDELVLEGLLSTVRAQMERDSDPEEAENGKPKQS